MKKSTTILTHAAVFAVGVTAASVIGTGRDGGRDGADPAESSTPTGRGGAVEGVAGTEVRPGRVSGRAQDGAAEAAKAGGPATDRLAMLVMNPDLLERRRGLMDLIDSLGPNDFAAVADEFRSLNHLGGSGDEFSLLLRGWAKVDPLAALAYVEEKSDGRGRNDILETWAGQDASAAESWAMAKHEGEGANPFMVAVIRGIAGYDMDHASRLMQAMPLSNERGEAIEAVARVLMAQGLEAALAFPLTIQDQSLKGGLVSNIAERYARQDPAGAADWLVSLGEGEIQNRGARQVADALARANPQEAATFVSKLAPEARAEAARGVIPRMSSQDIEGTARWVSTLAGTPNYDRVVEEFVWSCDSRAPEQSAAWIRGISDVEQQRRLYHRMLGDWARRDADAVRNWVASNDVPEDVQRRFTR